MTITATALAFESTQGSFGFLEALPSPDSGLEGGEGSRLFDRLVGSWDAEVVDHRPDGTDRRQSAEIHFAWVLEGRAIQDLWIAPARSERTAAGHGAGNRYGTTLRVYDPVLDAWRITWLNPVTGVETRLVGRRAGAQIVQTGVDAEGHLLRWVFVEIQPDSFHWRGERSDDGGESWICEAEYFARRRSRTLATFGATSRQLQWDWADRPGLEALSLDRGREANVAEGTVLVVLADVPVRARYRIEHDPAWRFRSASIAVGPPEAPRRLEILRLSDGRWQVDGQPRPDLDGCEDLDLMVTPYTNSPVLAAHPLRPGETRSLRVTWVRFPELEVRAVEQEYTRLDAPVGFSRYRYRNRESGFAGELTLDGEGLVVEYGPWRRREPLRPPSAPAIVPPP